MPDTTPKELPVPPTAPEPPPRSDQSSVPSVYSTIRKQILRSEIMPGSRLNIDKLARELDVSPTPVREALRQLQGDNLVMQEPGRGYSTTPLLDEAGLRELFEFRLLVEPWAARVAAQDRLINPGYLLERQLAQFQDLMQRERDVRFDIVEHDAAFHDEILQSAGNEVMRHAYAQTHCHLHTFRLYAPDHSGQTTLAEHQDIATAIRQRDPDSAEAAMRAHITNAYLRFAEAHNAPASSLLSEDPERQLPPTHLAI